MAARNVGVVFVCEDLQHAVFARRFFESRGYKKRQFRVEKSPSGRGSAEQWVRNAYVKELITYRARHGNHVVVILIDGDGGTVQERIQQLDKECRKANVQTRRDEERVAVFVPSRNIETWLTFLDGEKVDETTSYTKLKREKECQRHVDALSKMCDQGALSEPAPPSLVAACDEFLKRL